MNMIVIAAICLVVLIIIFLIFSGQMGFISKSFLGIGEEAGKKGEEATKGLDIFACKDDAKKCSFNAIMVCKDGEWEEYEKCSSDEVCKDSGCVSK